MKILFICVENAGRSQMAEAFFRKYSPSGYEPQSAGTKPADEVNPMVVQVMKEVGIDLTDNKPKTLSQENIDKAKTIVNMGCMDSKSCPSLHVNNIIEWNIEDPKGKSTDEIRKIRDKIHLKIKELISDLQTDS